MKNASRTLAWALFWALAFASLLVLALFAWAVLPVLAAWAQGGQARLWFFGGGGPVVAAAAAYLAIAAVVWARRRARRAGRR